MLFAYMFRHAKTLNLFHRSLSFRRRLISTFNSTAPHSNLNRYNFLPPPMLAPSNPDGPATLRKPDNKRNHLKPRYRPPSSFDRDGEKVIHSDLPFDFRFSYTESNPGVKPIGLREPKYSPFGPGRVDRVWTGVSAPAVDPTVRSVDGEGEMVVKKKTGRVKRVKSREDILGEPLTTAEKKILVEKAQRNRTKRQINLGRDGFTHNMLIDIHNNWKHTEAVRIKCLGVPTVDMENICSQLEEKSGGQIIHIQGSQIILYRGRRYYPKKRPVIPLMLWKPREPIYPKLIKTAIDGLTIDETKELRRRGLAAPMLTKLAKNGYYGNLVAVVRDAFLTDDLVRIDCKGMEKSDYRKIGYKLRNLVPCVLVTFEKEQVVLWREKRKHDSNDQLEDSECKSVLAVTSFSDCDANKNNTSNVE